MSIQQDTETDPLVSVSNSIINNQFSKMSKAVRGIFSLNSTHDLEPVSDNNNNNNNNNHNNWTEENKNTLHNWQTSLSKASFIYQYAKDVKKQKLTRLSLASFILTALATVISGIVSLAITSDTQPYKTIALAFSVVVFCINSSATILNGVISKIYKLDTDVEAYTKYIENIDELYADLSAASDLSIQLRENALTFINREGKKYHDLTRKGPDVPTALYIEADKKYDEFLKAHIEQII